MSQAFYERYWAGGDAPPEYDPLIQDKWRLLAPCCRAGSRVLDYGCGGGIFAQRLAEAGCEVVGVDVAEEAIRLARSRVPSAQFLQVRPGEQLHLDKFDIVWASEVLEHVYDPASLMREFAAALNRGGQLIVTVPYHGRLKNIAIALFRFERHFHPKGHHVRLFTRRTLQEVAREAGFVPRAFVGLGRLPYLWKSMFVRFVLP